MPGIIGSTGWDRSSAWIWLFSSTHSTTAFSGGLWYSPTTSTTFSAKNGSVDSLKESCRRGLRSNLRQIPPMGDLLSPLRPAIEGPDQCVSLPRGSSRAATPTSPRPPPPPPAGPPPPPPARPPGGNRAPPLRPRLDRHSQRLRGLGIRHPLGTRQDDPGPVSPPSPGPLSPAHQLRPLILRQ